jgi:7-cyano-7-deazaguanine synthase
MRNKAVVLLSGGLDSATTLYFARKQGFLCHCLIFDYNQRHRREVEAAKNIAKKAGCSYEVLKINLPWNGSSLLEKQSKLPGSINRISGKQVGIPSTYVPARNIVFLSFALSCAEATAAKAIFIGAHAQDYSGYPDCRPEFFRSFSKMALCGTKTGVEKNGIKIITPLINKKKVEIIALGIRLGVPFALTWSCYSGGRTPCGKCDSCFYRAKGFKELGIKDPLLS